LVITGSSLVSREMAAVFSEVTLQVSTIRTEAWGIADTEN